MMKLIKVMLNKNRGIERTRFAYPDAWDPSKINILAWEDSDNMGDVREYCVAIIHDDVYAEKLIASTEDIVEISEQEANQLGEVAKPQHYLIDEGKLPELLLAISKEPGERTKEEIAMLNPEDAMPGIRITPKFDVRRWYPE